MNRIRRQWESKILKINDGKLLHRPSTSYKKFLGRVPFVIIYIASAKSRSTKGASHPPVYYTLKVCGASLR